jgi:hypothetical protein
MAQTQSSPNWHRTSGLITDHLGFQGEVTKWSQYLRKKQVIHLLLSLLKEGKLCSN